MAKKRKPITTNPFTQWLLDYIEEHESNLTELSLQAGLSSGSLRSLVAYPDRKPSIETCIRLAQATGKSSEEIAQLAGLSIHLMTSFTQTAVTCYRHTMLCQILRRGHC